MKNIQEQISNNLFELSLDELIIFSQIEQGAGLSNVINGIEKEAYALIINDHGNNYDNGILRYSLLYVGCKENIVGYLFEDINVFDRQRDELTLGFSMFLADEFPFVDRIDTYNTFQSHLKSVLEKLEFLTYGTELIEQVEGNKATILLKFKKGVVFVPMIDKIEAYRALFIRTNRQVINKKKELIDYVYLFFDNRSKLTKIGTSKNPKFREKTLQSQEPIIEIIAKWKAPKRIERELHKKFKEKKKRGEWFDLNTKDYARIGEYMSEYELEE